MNILRLVKKLSIRFILIATSFFLQSCSNTTIGEKLENSFDITENLSVTEGTTKIKVPKKTNEIKKIKPSKKNDEKENEKESVNSNVNEENIMSKKNRFIQKSNKSIKKVIFKPQPYRIILKLSGANPSAPAETVTNALRKAGVQFEVEKIERFDETNLFKDTSMKR